MRTLVAIDLPSLEFKVKEMGFKHFPLEDFLDYLKTDEEFDIIETFVALQKRQPWENTDEAIIESQKNFDSKKYALEMSGATVITTQSSAYKSKQADSTHMIVKVLAFCLKHNIDYLVLFANSGDYSYLVAELRANGIRTALYAFDKMLANSLKRVAAEYYEAEGALTRVHEKFGDPNMPLTELKWDTYSKEYAHEEE